MKPNIVTPGAGIVSADGDVTSDGRNYKVLNGTSMATPAASGVCALILQANPSLTPLQLRAILQNTAEHRIPSVKGAFRTYPQSNDPNYDPGSGWGEADAYAACKEALNSATGVQVTQVQRPEVDLGAGAITVGWITQREHSFLGFDVYRAPDNGGVPGAFTQINPLRIAPAGHPDIEGVSNRTPYSLVDADPTLVRGNTYWYRVDWVDGGDRTRSRRCQSRSDRWSASPPRTTASPTTRRTTTCSCGLARRTRSIRRRPTSSASARARRSRTASSSCPGPAVLPARPRAPLLVGAVQHRRQRDGVPPAAPGPPVVPRRRRGRFRRPERSGRGFSLFVNDSPGSASGATYATNSRRRGRPPR